MTSAPRGHQDGRLHSRPSERPDREPLEPGVHRLGALGLPDHLLLVPAHLPDRPVLVAWFHGAGGDAARSLATVSRQAEARGALVLLPSSAGTTWDLLTGGVGRDAAALDAALGHVFDRSPVSRVGFAGFSDGASYALSLGLANGDLVDAVLAFSPGFAAPPTVLGRPRCFLAHGTADQVLPVERCGRRLAALLDRQDYDVRYEEFDGGHLVRPDLLEASLDWWLDGA